MTDKEWLAALLVVLEGEDWRVECAGVPPHFPYADAAVQHRITSQRKVILFPLQALGPPETMRPEILRQLTI